MVWTRWTDSDKETLRHHYSKLDAAELAARLGRSVNQVHQAAKRFCKLKPKQRLVDHKDKLLRLHAAGVSSVGIARELGVSPRTVCYWMSRLGLRGNGWSPESTDQRRRTRMAGWLSRNHLLVWWALRRKIKGGKSHEVMPGWSVEDLFHECLVHLVKYSRRYTAARSSVTTWVVVEVGYFLLKMKKRTRFQAGRERPGPDLEYVVSPHPEFSERERARLLDCLDRLTAEDRELLLGASRLETLPALWRLRQLYFQEAG